MKKFATGIALSAVALAMAAGVSIPADAATAPAISIKEQTGSGQVVTGWTFQYADLQPGQYLYFNVYKNNDPKQSETGYWSKNDDFTKECFNSYEYSDAGTESVKDTETTINAYDLTPGTKTVVAYLYDSNEYQAAYDAARAAYDAAWDNWDGTGAYPEMQYPDREDYYSPASNPVTIEVSMEAAVDTTVKAKSIEMDMNNADATGYEIYRKVGKKFKKIATVAKDTYKDTGLVANTEYTYRVRPYYKDADTGAVTYGKYTTFKRTTKGSALQLQTVVQKQKNVKLSWKKVKGAKSYEIYRSNGASAATTISGAESDAYESYTLLKTLGKKKKKFIDKKTMANEDYSYIVRAVMPKKKGEKADKDTIVQEGSYVDLSFDAPAFERTYDDAYGNTTVEWKKVYGIDGYIVKKYVEVYNADGSLNADATDWVEIGRLGADATKYTFAAEMTARADSYGNIIRDDTTEYRIYAYKGNTLSDYSSYTTERTMGLVDAVSATNVGNGIQVSWTPVPGAAYYQVYRVRAGSLLKNNDIGGYRNLGGTQVTEYVGAQAPVAVDAATVNAINASIDAYQNGTGERVDGYAGYSKLDPTKTYYYRNYQYEQDQFTGTSMIDYTYDMYPTSYDEVYKDGKVAGYGVSYFADDDDAIKKGPEDGVAYQYYVVAYAADPDTENPETVYNATPGTMTATEIQLPAYKASYQNTIGCKNVASVNFVSTAKTNKPVIKNVKAAAKKSAVIRIKKKVNGASEYKIYRSTKKKGKYLCVGTTKKLTFKDSGLISGKTYYYKVKAVAKNASNADVDSSFSKVKKVRAR
ncbi:MAG TPA: hypothetical protein H9880_10650 [Candidatus Anaerobutyricum avicola]|nr:hypothetical protein [Candidatus Anaerobutyricum avicola]